MKIKCRVIMVVNLILLWICLIIGLNTNCRDPFDFEPPPDSLIQAPDTPNLLYPPDSFVFMTETPYVDIIMRWSTVDSAEKYLLELNADTILVDTVSWAGYDNIEFGPYEWRVKAASSKWIGGYTEWSETRYFDTRPRPQPPQLLLPVDGTIYNDSLPLGVVFAWQPVDDARFYEFQLFLGSNLVQYEVYSSNVCTTYIDAPGRYYWYVKASNPHWQYDTEWSGQWCFDVN